MRLGLASTADYAEWCRARGFRESVQKSWGELEQEWCAYGEELAKSRAELTVDRDPGRLLAEVCAGCASSRDIVRPRWRALAERVEAAGLEGAQRRALRMLVEVVDRRAKLLLADAAFGDETLPMIDGLLNLARRRRHWIREPASWRPRTHNARRQLASLLRHLVARYPVPAFMDAAWLRWDASAELYRDWFLLIGSGENLRKSPAPLRLTKRAVHHFLEAPAFYTIEQALRWGQILALGGDPRLVEAVNATRLGRGFAHEEFWVTVLHFFVNNPGLDRAQVGPVIDYLQSQRFESTLEFVAQGLRERRPPPQPNLSMQGRTVASLLRQVEAWHRELGRAAPGSAGSWERSGIGELDLETGVRQRDLRVWRIRELLSAGELAAEGHAMRHCVALYARHCLAGSCSIWTLELHGFDAVRGRGFARKHLTIRVTRQGVIAEVRGRGNRLPTPEEHEILQRWARQEGLELSRFLG